MDVTTTILSDGPRNVIMQFTASHDGNGPQETGVVKVDVSALNPPCRAVKVLKASGDIGYGIVTLAWAGQQPKTFLTVSQQFNFDWCKSGGIVNDIIGSDDSANGDIIFSTQAFDAGSTYSVLLEMVKK